MSTLNLTFDCRRASVSANSYGMEVEAEEITGIDLNTPEVAVNVTLRTMIEAHGLTNVLDYLYDEHFPELRAFVKENNLC